MSARIGIFPRIHPAWRVAVGAFLVTFIAIGMVVNTATLFVEPISTEFSFARAEFSLTTTVAALAIAVGGFLAGPLGARLDIRVLMGCAGALLIGAFAAQTLCTDLPGFLLCAGLFGLGAGLSAFAPALTIVTAWFHHRRGIALGFVLSGSAAGAVVFSLIGGALIATAGWRVAILVMSGAAAVVLLIGIGGLILPPPERIGATAYGAGTVDPAVAGDGMPLRRAVRTPQFWLIAAMLVLQCGVTMGFQAHFVPYLTSVGIDAEIATLLFSVCMASLVVGKIGLGYLADRLGLLAVSVILTAVYVAAVLAAVAADQILFAVVFAVLFGLTNSGSTVLAPLWSVSLFGPRFFPMIFPTMNVFVVVGSGLGSPLAGLSFDLTGSYVPAWWYFLGALLVSLGLSAAAARWLPGAAPRSTALSPEAPQTAP